MTHRYRPWFLAWLLALAFVAASDTPPARVPVDAFRDVSVAVETSPTDAPVIARVLPAADPEAFGRLVAVTSGRIVVRAEPELADHARALAPVADAHLAEIERRLGAVPGPGAEVRLVSSTFEMAGVAPPGAPPPGWASGVTYAERGLVLLAYLRPGTGRFLPLESILRHELVHLVVHRATNGHPIPTWFSEGLALFEAGESWGGRSEQLLAAAMRDRLIPLERLTDGYPSDPGLVPLAYAQGLDVVTYLADTYGFAAVRMLLREVGRGRPFDAAFSDAFGRSVVAVESDWREHVRVWYRWLPALLSGATLWALISAMLVWAWMRQRRHRQDRYAEWDREEEEAERTLLEADLDRPPPKPWGGIRVPTPDKTGHKPPVVYHGGRYHTLH